MMIQKLRLQRGWSQQQLAELCGLSTRTIQRLENGNSASIESLKSLAAVFEVDFSILQGDSAVDNHSPASNINDNLPPAAPLPPAPGFRPQRLSREEMEALRHVRQLKRLYGGAMIFCIVIPLLAGVNWLTHPGNWWVLWVALAWGTVLLIRTIKTIGWIPFLGPQWEREQVEKRLGRKL